MKTRKNKTWKTEIKMTQYWDNSKINLLWTNDAIWHLENLDIFGSGNELFFVQCQARHHMISRSFLDWLNRFQYMPCFMLAVV